jgi:hypothetical protein
MCASICLQELGLGDAWRAFKFLMRASSVEDQGLSWPARTASQVAVCGGEVRWLKALSKTASTGCLGSFLIAGYVQIFGVPSVTTDARD